MQRHATSAKVALNPGSGQVILVGPFLPAATFHGVIQGTRRFPGSGRIRKE